jgi:site-specific recombinase XerD
MRDMIEDSSEITLPVDTSISSSSLINNFYIKAATADNTRRAYRSDIRHFEQWGGVLPASSEIVSAYLQRYAASLNPRTLARRITAIKNWHNYQGFIDPTNHPAIQKTMVGILKIHGKPKDKAPPLSPQELLKIVNKLREDRSFKALRDSALLQIGYFGSFRRSELVSIQYENITWLEEGIKIMLTHSKTDQLNEGQAVVIPLGNAMLCPVTALKKWCDIADIKSGAVFCSVKKGGNISENALPELSVNHILKIRALEVGIKDAEKLSSHSLRRGFTTNAYLAGGDISTLMRQCRWKKADTCLGYIEEVDRFKENPGNKIFEIFSVLK